MGGGASKKAFNLCELLRRDDKEEEAAEFIEKANPKTFVLGEYDGRIPFALAAKLGKARFVKQMFARDEDRQYLYGMYLDGALLSSCEGQTDSELVALLLSEGARVNAVDGGDNTALMHAAKKSDDKIVWTQRLESLKPLVDAKADMDVLNVDEESAIMLACETMNLKGALRLAAYGADIRHVEKSFKRMTKMKTNWVPGSVLAKFAFEDPKFMTRLKKDFYKRFDKDNNGYLDQPEMTRFIAYHVKMQFKAGLLPTVAFSDDSGRLGVDQVEQLLKERCKDLLRSYLTMDRDLDGKWEWAEILYVVKDFYTNLWTQNKPAVIEDDRLEGTAEGAAMDAVEKGIVGSADEEGQLPANWYAVEDKNTGKIYYANSVTQETTWERPKDNAWAT